MSVKEQEIEESYGKCLANRTNGRGFIAEEGAEKSVSEHQDMAIEITHFEQQIGQKIKKCDSVGHFRYPWDKTKRPNIRVVRAPGGEERGLV